MKKKGQFFILAAVLIASIVFSLTVSKNLLGGSEKPQDFYAIGDQLDREVSAVLDYDLVSGSDNISNFINETMQYLRATKPYTEVVFMYYQNGNLTVENYANSTVMVKPTSLGVVCSGHNCDVTSLIKKNITVIPSDVINLTMNGQNFFYNLSKGSKSYIVLMRSVNREVYVDVKE